MEANARSPLELFDGKVCYLIPAFQRPYVWNEEDQWQPLWADVERVTHARLEAGTDAKAVAAVANHFLGAIVLKQSDSTESPSRPSVIDGQQRITTLQILLDAAQEVIESRGLTDEAESIQELVMNGAARFKNTSHRFKLTPSRADRTAFEQVMDNGLQLAEGNRDTSVALAHEFFRRTIEEWATTSEDELGPSADELIDARLRALASVLQHHLLLVVIDLAADDDDQMIFETLNDRGTPLLAADLIKNYVFQRLDDIGVDVDAWDDLYWEDFDDPWWREQVRQGRLYRARIDLFLQYWLTMRAMDEIPADAVFRRFRNYVEERGRLGDEEHSKSFLEQLSRDAGAFRDLAQLDPKSAAGSFYWRVVEALELGAFIPLLLWLISDHHPAAPAQTSHALGALESWAVRRTLLRRTMKDVNKNVVTLLKELDVHPSDQVGDRTIAYLAAQTAESRTWPTDEELLDELPGVRAYGSIKQQRLRAILGAVELTMRDARNEDVSLPTKLDVEHIMPQGWQAHWPILDDEVDPTDRDRLINTIGNLTLVTQKLNRGELSNRPWTDVEAEPIAPHGKFAGQGKRTLLKLHSLLLLNKDVVEAHPDAWTDDDIRKRSDQLAKAIVQTWARPTSVAEAD